MCGIVFILSIKNNNVIDIILNSLSLIQNRGYDSMGIVYYNRDNDNDNDNNNNNDNNNDNNNETKQIKDNFKICKYASTNEHDCFDLLKTNINYYNIKSNVAIGHTRWATHGSKTINNAHPHISEKKNIILVHNGIINNFSDLKLKLIKHGVNFIGETDSEVIANLIEYYILQFNLSIEDAIKTTLLELEGTWALIIIYTKQPGSYYITRKGSPLLLGKTENYIMCSSELNGFNGLIYDYIVLNNNDIIKITNNNYFSINNTNNDTNNHTNNDTNNSINNYVIKKNIQDKSLYNNEYKHWMLKEIMEQSETIQKAYNYGGRILNNNIKLGGLDNLKDMIINYSIENIVLIGCGTSYHAGLLGEIYLRSSKNVVNVSCFNACEFNKNCLPNTNKTIITLFLSQSGETLDVYNSLKICKQHNCITVGLINKVDSLIARSVDCGIYLNAGDEISVPSTKSFTSMIICLSLFDLWFSYLYNNNINNLKIINNMRSLSCSIYQILNDFDIRKNINNISNYIIENNISNIFILGKKKLYPIALEAALKIKEVTYIHAEGFSSGSLKHGPFSLLDNLNLTILLIDYNDTDNYNSLKSTFYELKSRETNILIITNTKKVIKDLNLNEDNKDISIKTIVIDNLEYYNEILIIIIIQYLSYIISINKNINPDKPRNLAKVVSVE